MQQIREWIIRQQNHTYMNCLVLVIMGYAVKQGWLLDKYKQKAFTLEELCVDLCKNKDLEGKPKLIILQQYVEGK